MNSDTEAARVRTVPPWKLPILGLRIGLLSKICVTFLYIVLCIALIALLVCENIGKLAFILRPKANMTLQDVINVFVLETTTTTKLL